MADFDFTLLGGKPISSENPVGEDIKYHPSYEWLEKELAKLSNPVVVERTAEESGSGGEKTAFTYQSVDWDKIVETSSTILESQSKHLRVAAWLTRGLLETERVTGVIKGLDIFLQLIRKYWENVFPTRAQARTASILLLRDYITEFFEGKPGERAPLFSVEDLPALERVASLVGELNNLVKEKLAATPATMDYLLSIVEDRIAKTKASTVKPVVNEPSMTANVTLSSIQPQSMETQSPPREEEIVAVRHGYDFAKPADRLVYFEDLQETARQLHVFGLEHARRDPLPYRWVRIVYWSPVEYSPDIPFVPARAPNEVQRQRLFELWDNGDWEKLFDTSERQFPSFWYWLDLQRYSIEALDHLGDGYAQARDAIIGELIFFLRRFPFLVNLTTQDDVAVATPETQEWVSGLVLPGQIETAARSGVSGTVDQTSESDLKSAVFLNAGESVSTVLAEAREQLSHSQSGREQFVIQLKLAEYLLAKKEVLLAYSHLDRLDQLMTAHQLERWEPALAVETLRLLHSCSLRMGKIRKDEKREFVEKANAILTRIAALDPVVAGAAVKESE